jgi:peptide deformylase
VNPEIVERGEETDVVEEGCLSIQGVLVPIERPTRVTLAGKDEYGEDVRFELDDIFARAAQHESDHLDGVLIIDRTTPEARREALALLRPRIVIS